MTDNTINYLASGRLGDFILQLSIINENYKNTGKKGNLYMTEQKEGFLYGIVNTFNDIKDIIRSQEYINIFKIHEGEHTNINLSNWRHNGLLYRKNFYHIFKDQYNVEFGKHKWLNVEYDEKWKDKILVNHSSRRIESSLNFKRLEETYKDNMIFIANDDNDYILFKNRYNVNIEQYKPASFKDLCVAINSCKLLIGGLSSPLCISMALHHKTLISISNNLASADNVNADKFNEIWDFISYSYSYNYE
jgi:hypothetical protein